MPEIFCRYRLNPEDETKFDGFVDAAKGLIDFTTNWRCAQNIIAELAPQYPQAKIEFNYPNLKVVKEEKTGKAQLTYKTMEEFIKQIFLLPSSNTIHRI